VLDRARALVGVELEDNALAAGQIEDHGGIRHIAGGRLELTWVDGVQALRDLHVSEGEGYRIASGIAGARPAGVLDALESVLVIRRGLVG